MRPVALITGFAGMVGSHLADYLLATTDWDIVGFCRWNEDMANVRHLFARVNAGDRVKLCSGDICDVVSLSSVIRDVKPDYVFHLAAQSYPLASFESPIATLQTNVIGTANLLEAMREHARHATVHVCSSSEVFGRVSSDKLPIGEECTFHPASPYAISKIGTDMLGRFYAEAYGMTTLTTRMFTHTGPRRSDVFAESTFAKQIAMIEAGLQEPVVRVGNLASLRTWADVRDAVHAYHMLVTVDPIAGSYYNIGGEHVCTVGEMLDTLCSMSSAKIRIEVDPARLRPIDADLQVPDTSKFKQHTGWEPVYSFNQTMTDLLEYWRARIAAEGTQLSRSAVLMLRSSTRTVHELCTKASLTITLR